MCKLAVNRAALARCLYVGAKNGTTRKTMVHYPQLVQAAGPYGLIRTAARDLGLYFLFFKKIYVILNRTALART